MGRIIDSMSICAPKKRELSIILAACVISFSISVGVRLLELPKWASPELQIRGDYILASHDAYTWVSAAADSKHSEATSAMSIFLRFAAEVLNTSHAKVAFWAPAFLASLLVIPLVLWSVLLGAPVTAALIATAGSLIPAYFTRTRLGFFDTDWAALLFPMLIGFVLAAWLRSTFRARNDDDSSGAPDVASIKLPIAAVLLILIGLPWHNFIGTFVVASLWISAGLIVFLSAADRRIVLLWILASLCVAALWGLVGAVLGVVLLLSLGRSGVLRRIRSAQLVVIVLVLLLLVSLAFQETQGFLIDRIVRYAGFLPSRVAAETSDQSIVFPASAISIAELQRFDLLDTLSGMAYFWWVGILGAVLFLFLIWREPTTALLAPLVLLGFASIQIGSRFAMFAGPVLLMATIASIEWSVRTRHFGRVTSPMSASIIAISLALVAGRMISSEYGEFPILPVVRKDHAEALTELGNVALGEGLVWTWWDYGSATQYYAGLETFADGSRNTGRFLYALGKVLGANDPDVARNFVRLSAMSSNRPWQVLESQGVNAFDQVINEGSSQNYFAHQVEPQYFVTTWEGLPSLSWITYYGNWDFSSMSGLLGYVKYPIQHPSIDMRTGELLAPSERRERLASIDVLGDDTTDHQEFEGNQGGHHLLLNSATGEGIILDDRSYNTLLVQLLILGREQLISTDEFELVIDRYPHLRIFRISK